jgi:hypothetical protein
MDASLSGGPRSDSHAPQGLSPNLAVENPAEQFAAKPFSFSGLRLRRKPRCSPGAGEQAVLMSDHDRRS